MNKVFLTDVCVPVESLVGAENRGWTYAKYLLGYERTNIAGVGGSLAAFERLKLIAGNRSRNGRRLVNDPLFAARVARLEIELANTRTTNLRAVAGAAGGGPQELDAPDKGHRDPAGDRRADDAGVRTLCTSLRRRGAGGQLKWRTGRAARCGGCGGELLRQPRAFHLRQLERGAEEGGRSAGRSGRVVHRHGGRSSRTERIRRSR